MVSVRDELEMVQRALKIQTRRCRQLVVEYTKRLQIKEQQYEAEKRLRDDQLSRVLRALLVCEARLRQEQKYISHQLEEKDYAIKKQQAYIQKLLTSHYCKNCDQYYSPNVHIESPNSSLEYVVTDQHDYQSSTFESLDSSSETYASISEKDSDSRISTFGNSISSEENVKTVESSPRNTFIKNKNKDSLNRRTKRVVHRKSISNYFEVLKMQNDNSASSNDENSLSYENNECSLLNTSLSKNKDESEKEIGTDEYSSLGSTEIGLNYDNSLISTSSISYIPNDDGSDKDESKSKVKITDTIPIFEGDGETNDNWYASASEQEDEEHRGVYRNNPVLECMNQILMQNINDPLVSPPKTPNSEKKFNKTSKKVKFSDEEDSKNYTKLNESESNYYETPIQKTPNFYETPQSIYSNDYEQILSQCSETFQKNSSINNTAEVHSASRTTKHVTEKGVNSNHYYIAMDSKSEQDEIEVKVPRKSKILRTPPALPPKPANLLSKYKIQHLQYEHSRDSEKSLDSEPDYCSISEINLPTIDKNKTGLKTVASENNFINIEPILKKIPKTADHEEKPESAQVDKEIQRSPQYKPLSLNEPFFNGKFNKSVDDTNDQTCQKMENTPKKSSSPEIPKLPQVTEIIIPEENEPKSEMCVNHDNYIKNNTQILQQKTNHSNRTRPIQMGSTVSSLIASFNNKQLLSEINHKSRNHHKNNSMFSSFENLQNLETHSSDSPVKNNFENFDLSQNFEEFKLDDCEIEDFSGTRSHNTMETENTKVDLSSNKINSKLLMGNINFSSPTRVELVRATNDVISTPCLNVNSLQQFKKKLELEKNRVSINNQLKMDNNVTMKHNEPTYEHFLECTGLSSKSILTPSRLISNHKNMMKPKDVKLRSKVKSNSVLDREQVAVKYWSEPFL
ncbi:hypothetical protein RI129_001215 [Pyrocoelia pectoralis]|uniref:Uncharacterized protein n=1 Tax=Pyrocoelia pectoralis TaxID=417401 RepID=A0AAN7VT69_9COLE